MSFTKLKDGYCCNIENFPSIDSFFSNITDMPLNIKQAQCLFNETQLFVSHIDRSNYFFNMWVLIFALCGSFSQLVLYSVSTSSCMTFRRSAYFILIGWSMKLVIPIFACFLPWHLIYRNENLLSAYITPLQAGLRYIGAFPVTLIPSSGSGNMDDTILNFIKQAGNSFPGKAAGVGNMGNIPSMLVTNYNIFLNLFKGVYLELVDRIVGKVVDGVLDYKVFPAGIYFPLIISLLYVIKISFTTVINIFNFFLSLSLYVCVLSLISL